MDNNNNNKRSPLDEIRRVTQEATRSRTAPTQSQRPVQAPTQAQTPAQPQRPVQAPTQAQAPAQPQRPVQAPTQAQAPAQPQRPVQVPTQAQTPTRPIKREPLRDEFDIDAPNFQRSTAGGGISRADKVRMARESALRARENAQQTRIMNIAEMSPEQQVELERQREEARLLVQSNANKNKDRYATRVTKAVNTDKKIPKNKKPSKKKKEEKSAIAEGFEETVGRGVLSNTVKAVIYIVSVLVVSGCLALFAILVGNDCFAFVKSDVDVVVTIPENADLNDIAKALKENDIIKYPNMFKLYIMIRGKDTDNYVAGNHTVNGMMGYDSLIAQFKPYSTREEITVTIVEGSTTQEIIDLLVSKGIGTEEGFIEAIQNYDFDFWFLDELENTDLSERIYRLDGYLFPDTYNFFTDSSEVDVIYKLLSNFETKFDIENKARAEELGLTVDDIVIMASLIQKEAMYVTDYPLVSSVFHNRIDDGMKLESNATVQYTMPTDEVELKLTYDQITKYDNGYNTYLYSGLPVGPICNSSLNALNWAMYPTDTDYFYFVSDKEGYNHYAITYSEHEKNVAEYQE